MTGKIEYLQSVDTAVGVLMEIAQRPDKTLSEIARHMAETKPRVLRMLRTLERRGLVRRTTGGVYRLGNAALVLGTAASTQVDLVRLALPVMESIGARVVETVQLRIIDNSEALCIAKFEPARDLRVHAMIGRRRPLHAGSSKVLLAFLPAAVQQDFLPQELQAMTPHTITSRERLLQQLDAIRASGYCISRGEVSEHLVSVAVPVLAGDGSVIAALNIAAPAFRTQSADLDRFRDLLIDAAVKLTKGLGW